MPQKRTCSNPVVHMIGQISVDFQITELFVEGAIWQMMAPEGGPLLEVAQAVTAEMSFDRKVHAFASVYRLQRPDAVDDVFRQLVADLFKVQELRNAVIHATWNYSEKLQAFTRMKASAKAKHGLRRTLSPVAPAKLVDVQNQIEEVANRFGAFVIERVQKRV